LRWAEIGEGICSVSRTLSIVGDRWSLLIIRSAFLGTRKFSDFQSEIGLTRPRLSERLSKLVEHEVFHKVKYQENPVRYEYRLTDKGQDLYPIIVSMYTWGDKWVAGKNGKAMEYVHKSCGNKIVPIQACPDCAEVIAPNDMVVQPGPAIKALLSG